MEAHVFDADVFQAHVFAGFEQKGRHREMNDVEVAQGQVAHEGRPAFVAEEENARSVAPQDAVLDRDALDVVVRGV